MPMERNQSTFKLEAEVWSFVITMVALWQELAIFSL
jgi:hypothetical protein